jgi:hypothetical protein
MFGITFAFIALAAFFFFVYGRHKVTEPVAVSTRA